MNIFKSITGLEEREARFRELKSACQRYERYREQLKKNALKLFEMRKEYLYAIDEVKESLMGFTHLPNWCIEDIHSACRYLDDFRLAANLSPMEFAKQTDKTGRTVNMLKENSGLTGIGTGVGIGVAAGGATALGGSSAAMAIATVMGTASTGTAISALSGVAATNAALAWLGGGAVAAGGAGMAGGSLVLAMFGPIGWTIAGVSALSGFALVRSKNKKMKENAEIELEQIKKDNELLMPKITHLQFLIKRSESFWKNKFLPSVIWLNSVQATDYTEWSEDNRRQLERLANNVSNLAHLINERI